MSSFTKLAFVQGLQRSLISARVLPSYSSQLQAKVAATLAADNVKSDPADKEPEEEEVVDALTELVEDVPADDTVDAIQAIADSGELEEALEVLESAAEGNVEASTAEEAVEKTKQAAIAYRFLAKLAGGQGHIGKDPSSMLSASDAQADPRDKAKYNKGGKPIVSKVTSSKATHTVHALNPNADSQNVNFDTAVSPKHAAWLLRKLADGGAGVGVDTDASAMIGKGALPAQTDGRPAGFANNQGDPILNLLDLKDGHDTNVAVAHPNSEAGTPRSDKSLTPPEKEAVAHFIRKTAAEVGHFLPNNLSPRDKVAALRTMSLMNNDERAVYLGRIKHAVDAAIDEEQSKDINAVEKEVKGIKDEMKKEDEEKEAAYMLRQLGIGV